MNFVETFKKGKEGKNIGLPTGIDNLTKALQGIRRKAIYGIAAAPKVGKTKFVDFSFLMAPYCYMLKNPDVKIKWVYFSFEVDRVQKEFNIAAFWFWKDYNITKFEYEGKTYDISGDYLMGNLMDESTNKVIPVNDEHEEILKVIYSNRIVPMFGEYSADGRIITKGVIDFIEERDNPTGLRNYIMNYAEKNGTFLHEPYKTKEHSADGKSKEVTKQRITGYKPNDPNEFFIIITDHIRKLKRERSYSMKENIDKWIEYQVELRNWCGYTFVDICHINRNLANIERLKFNSEFLYPTGEDLKDTGNLSEEADYMLTIMNPNDDKYGIKKHFGLDISTNLYPNYRSIHLVEARQGKCPAHIQVDMFGAINVFTPLTGY